MDYTEVQDENEIDDIEHIKYIEVDTPKKKKPKKRKPAIAKRSMGKNHQEEDGTTSSLFLIILAVLSGGILYTFNKNQS